MGRLIDPIPVIGQFFLISIQFRRKIGSLDGSAEKCIPRPVPVCETIDFPGISILGN